jgi:hypothetical protein
MPSYIYGCGSFQNIRPGILVFWAFGREYEPLLIMEKRRIFLTRCSDLINYNFYITISVRVQIFKVITILSALLEKFEVRDFVYKITCISWGRARCRETF